MQFNQKERIHLVTSCPKLNPRLTDMLIVGGGLIGLCAEYFLNERSCEAIDVT